MMWNINFYFAFTYRHCRKGFGDKGPLEIGSEDFLDAAKNGDIAVVKEMLHAGKVHVDVADVNGNTALLGAAVRLLCDKKI